LSATTAGVFLGIDGLEARARTLAGSHTLAHSPRSRGGTERFYDRMKDNVRALRVAYRILSEDVRRAESVAPAAEWLLDNFHVLEAEIVGLQHDLPRDYYLELPKLADGESPGGARAYALACELIQNSDGRLDLERMTRFLGAYQAGDPLTIGELWAWPSMLKAALVDGMRRLAEITIADRDARHLAGLIWRRFEARAANAAGAEQTDPEGLQAAPPLACLVELLSRLRDQGPHVSSLQAAVEKLLAERGLSSDEAIHTQYTHDAQAHVSMGNAVTSLRFCASLDWSLFFERVSLVEQTLQRDPAGVYGRMDFLSRDRYRQALEEMAGPTGGEQVQIAELTVENARQAEESTEHSGDLRRHVGYYLIGPGRAHLETQIGYRPELRQRLRRFLFSHASAFYLGSIAALTVAMASLAASILAESGWDRWAFLLILIPASDLAIGLVQWGAARFAPPRRLPRLELRDGVPPDARTMVVIPTLLASRAGINELIDHLEVLALGNRDPQVFFAILSDFPDAPAEEMPEDGTLLATAREGIEALNTRYAEENWSPFYLFHRARLWNAKEGCWMGWERKRGKIEEFNALLRGSDSTSYALRVGDLTVLPSIRYCITLDSDTLLPRGAARQLIGIALHPLHRPRLDPRRGWVTAGYGILQPRVSVALSSAGGSRFARIFSGHTGVDPYTTAVSDTYQDLFGEGIFTGKGLYDVDAFMAALAERVPENAVLSHDLFEGLYARVGLVSDVEVVDDYPENLLAHARRQHRWVRGDWQILLWILPWIPTRTGVERNRLPLIARWKIFDNIRRSLVAPAILLLLAWAWLSLPGSPLGWTLAALATMSLPIGREIVRLFAGPGPQQALRVHLRLAVEELQVAAGRVLLTVALLPYHAYRMLDAIGVTVVRIAITQRRLLEWESAAAVNGKLAALGGWAGLRHFLGDMAASPAAAGVLGIAILAARPASFPVAMPFLLLWLTAPGIGMLLSRPRFISTYELEPGERELVMRLAAETWSYFTTFAGPGDHFLPPDNVQEAPATQVAHRTSPTNIGLALLSTLAAHDLGFIDAGELGDRLERMLAAIESLEQHAGHLLNWYDTETLAPLAPRYVSTVDSGNLAGSLLTLGAGLRQVAATPAGRAYAEPLQGLAARCEALFAGMDFSFLYDRRRRLFAVGYRLADSEGPGRLDPSFYDLLASEARLASFLAIAKGDAPQDHWFNLNRQLVGAAGRPTLVSWSASMFEYLMPLLIVRSYRGTLLDDSCRNVVEQQIAYARRQGVPWGISESAYNFVDHAGQYQYKAFGVPGLGLKRGLTDELVVAPYATVLAGLVDPEAAVRNLRYLYRLGLHGQFGCYEAIDFTPPRHYGSPDLNYAPGAAADQSPRLRRAAGTVITAFFAHHQGMILVALANLLRENVMVERFHSDPRIRATELLLQEHVARHAVLTKPRPAEATRVAPPVMAAAPRVFRSPHTIVPRAHLLSNGNYTAIVTNAGCGASFWRGLAVTRWREDPTRDLGSQFIYLRDVRSGVVWSAAYQPSGCEPDDYRVTYLAEKAIFKRRDQGIESQLEVAVSPDEDVEVRRLSLANHSNRLREIEVTSYVELALAPPAEDEAHPAFGKLFLTTEALPDKAALLCCRRRRIDGAEDVWAIHVLSVEGRMPGPVEWETDRARFLGRGRDPSDALSIDGRPLSGTTGPVLDAVLSLRTRVRLEPGGFTRLAFATGVSTNRSDALALAERYHDAAAAARTLALSFTHAQIGLQHLGMTTQEAQLYMALASRVIYADPSFRADPAVIAASRGGQPGLWRHGISGDLPIVLVRVVEDDDLSLVHDLLKAQQYWRLKAFSADLVILNEHPSGYRAEMQDAIASLLERGPWRAWRDRRGGVFLLAEDTTSEDDRALLAAAARVVLSGERGNLATQLNRPTLTESLPMPVAPCCQETQPSPAPGDDPGEPAPIPPLDIANGLGGFSDRGREYVVVLEGERETPLPWAHVLANRVFGTVLTASGSAFTWALNSRENRLTAFANDPVEDPTAEAIFLRDEESGCVWSTTPGPLPRKATNSRYVMRFRPGVARFAHTAHGIAHELQVAVHLADPVKISRLTLRNQSDRWRRIGIFAYVEWALGRPRAGENLHVVSELDAGGTILAWNRYHAVFPDRVAFFAASEPAFSVTGDRREFIGRNGSLRHPAALGRPALRGRFGAGLDPCAAMHIKIDLAPGETREIAFVLGQGGNRASALALSGEHRSTTAARDAVEAVQDHWDEFLGRVKVKTPDDSFDLLMNHWAPYQSLVSRVLARCGYYQPGGAYGFRDQLQDVLGLGILDPALEREHILRAASRQFGEGDVQHWWHPDSGSGVRTRCSDDLLWLPYAVAHYVGQTADGTVLDERVPYLSAPLLLPHQTEAYGTPAAGEVGTLYEHCLRAIDRGLTAGQHGLPLIGSGDWNDGMNRVGHEGKGESVWNGWFLCAVLREFIAICMRRGDEEKAAGYRRELARLEDMLELSWDGDWYRRGYFDDGTTLGSARDEECKIDSIAQSWAVLSGARVAPHRTRRAMDAVRTHLVRRGPQVVLLLTPPFDRTARNPGYIQGYPPGIRENGGQYTHAAIWTAMAVATLGSGDEAAEILHMLNPINRTRTPEQTEQYKVEPYVMAGDVYSHPMHVGRGGWTWYTGSAAWAYRLGIETILGLKRHGDTFALAPCIPGVWPGFTLDWRWGGSIYEIEVTNPEGHCRGILAATLDGEDIDPEAIPLRRDGRRHQVKVLLGVAPPCPPPRPGDVGAAEPPPAPAERNELAAGQLRK